MAEKSYGLIHSVTAYLRRYAKGGGGFLRHGRRFEARLPFIVTLLGTGGSSRYLRDAPPKLVGYTRDVSETGLTLLLPSVRVGDAYFTDAGSRLEVKLELPGGAVRMMTSSVRFEQLACKEAGCGYLFAVSIVEMKNDERERYNKYLRSAKGKGKRLHEGLKAQPSATNITPNGKPQVSTWDALTPASVNKAFEKFLSK